MTHDMEQTEQTEQRQTGQTRQTKQDGQAEQTGQTERRSQTTAERVKDIKRTFRMYMNGAAARSMRDKGLDYRVIWGVPLPELKRMAEGIGKDRVLAEALFADDCRESKILAVMTMPPAAVTADDAERWMARITTQETAEMAALYLFRHVPCAPDIAFRWIASDDALYRLCGFNVLTRLFMDGREPNPRAVNEYADQLAAALRDVSLPVRKAALASARRFAELGIVYSRIADSVLRQAGIE